MFMSLFIISMYSNMLQSLIQAILVSLLVIPIGKNYPRKCQQALPKSMSCSTTLKCITMIDIKGYCQDKSTKQMVLHFSVF